MRPLSLWLARHGQSTANIGQAAATPAAITLTQQGHQQAHALAAQIAESPDLLVLSPLRRAIETAAPILARWPALPCETWPIEEFTYLSPLRCANTTPADRKGWVEAYWQRSDPAYIDDMDAESFGQFWDRVTAFRERVAARKNGVVLAVGHGQFFHACLMQRSETLAATAQTMQEFRRSELAGPLPNGALIEMRLPFNVPTAG